MTCCGKDPGLAISHVLDKLSCHFACCSGTVIVVYDDDEKDEQKQSPQEEPDGKKESCRRRITQSAVAFGGVSKLLKEARKKNISPAQVKRWLKKQLSYTLHKGLKRKFKKNRVIVNGMDEQWQADLVDMQSFARDNKGIKFLLTVIDVLSKRAWAVPLKNKTGAEIIKAFETIFKEGRTPEKLQTDAGSEFMNRQFQTFLKKWNVYHFVTYNQTKAQIVERFNRTLKNKMWRYFDYANTHRYWNVLDDLVDGYNRTYHRSIKMTPLEVTKFNAQTVWKRLYPELVKRKKSDVKFKFKVGDLVRITRSKGVFEKGYAENWTEEMFKIKRRIARRPPVYTLEEYDGTSIIGTFYEQELQKVEDEDFFRIEKILKKRGTNRRNKEVLVKWRGYPSKYNSWIKESELHSIVQNKA